MYVREQDDSIQPAPVQLFTKDNKGRLRTDTGVQIYVLEGEHEGEPLYRWHHEEPL